MLDSQDNPNPLDREPRVSIIVAVLNGAGTLRRCINSIAAQTYANKELIVMDGGSTDETVEIIKSNEGKVAYWESSPDRGIYHAWNKALEHAGGEWVCFLGADDCFVSTKSLSKMVSGAAPGVDFVFGRNELVNQEDRVLKTFGSPWDWAQMKKKPAFTHVGALHRSSLFERYGRFTEKYRIAGDYEFLLRVGGAVVASYVDEPTARMGHGGVSTTQLRTVLKEVRQIQSEHPEIGPYRAWKNYLGIGYEVTSRRAVVRPLRRAVVRPLRRTSVRALRRVRRTLRRALGRARVALGRARRAL